MVERGDFGEAKAASTETGASAPEPSTPLLSSERETIGKLLYDYLSDGFCEGCSDALKGRIAKLASSGNFCAPSSHLLI